MAPIKEIKIPNAVRLFIDSPRNINAKIAINGTLKFIRIDELIAVVYFRATTSTDWTRVTPKRPRSEKSTISFLLIFILSFPSTKYVIAKITGQAKRNLKKTREYGGISVSPHFIAIHDPDQISTRATNSKIVFVRIRHLFLYF